MLIGILAWAMMAGGQHDQPMMAAGQQNQPISTSMVFERRTTAQFQSALVWIIGSKGVGNLRIVCTWDVLSFTQA